MPFFHYSQNNSGGNFVFDADRGISCHVVIEAKDYKQANDRAETIGLYWDGVSEGKDCECCGDRWTPMGTYNKGEKAPSIYGHDVSSGYYQGGLMTWMKAKGPEGYIRFANGTMQPILAEPAGSNKATTVSAGGGLLD